MASRAVTSTALLLTVNLLFFTLVSSCQPTPSPKPKQHTPKGHTSKPSKPKPYPTNPPPISGHPPPHIPTYPTPSHPPPPSPVYPPPAVPSQKPPQCPRGHLNVALCGNLLTGLLNNPIGAPLRTPCCSLIDNLVGLDAAVCLCTNIKANLLGLHIVLPVNLGAWLNYCGKKVPEGFLCY